MHEIPGSSWRAPRHDRSGMAAAFDGLFPRSGACQSGPERVAKALFATFPNYSRMHRGDQPTMAIAKNAPVAQLDRAPDYESGGQEFESLRARHFGTKRGTASVAVFALEAAQDPRASRPAKTTYQFPLSIGSERMRMRDSSNTTTAPLDNAGSKGDKFAKSNASCRAGVRVVAPRNRRSDGAASRVKANRVAKSVSADTMTRSSSRARTIKLPAHKGNRRLHQPFTASIHAHERVPSCDDLKLRRLEVGMKDSSRRTDASTAGAPA